MDNLVQRLAAIQEREGLSDRKFAAKLGLSNGLWSGVRTGERTLGRRALQAIEAVYPELSELVASYWMARFSAGEQAVGQAL